MVQRDFHFKICVVAYTVKMAAMNLCFFVILYVSTLEYAFCAQIDFFCAQACHSEFKQCFSSIEDLSGYNTCYKGKDMCLNACKAKKDLLTATKMSQFFKKDI